MTPTFKELKEIVNVQEYLVNILIRLTVLERILEEKGIIDKESYMLKNKEVSEDVMSKIQKALTLAEEAAKNTNVSANQASEHGGDKKTS